MGNLIDQMSALKESLVFRMYNEMKSLRISITPEKKKKPRQGNLVCPRVAQTNIEFFA